MKIKDIAKVTNGKSDVKDAVNDGKYLFFDRSTIVKRSNKFLFDSKSIIIPGEDSRMVFEPRYYEGKFNLHQRCYVIYDLNQKYCTKYLYYKLKTLTKHFANVFVGSTVPSLRLDHITDLDIEFPILSVQQKIAYVLSALDSKIELNNRINAELEAMAKTLYNYWFVQFDFPDKNGKPYKASGGKMVWNEELKREIPEGFLVKKLKEFATTGSGGTPLSTKKEYYENGNIPWINSGELNELYIIHTNNYITKEGLENSSAKLFPYNTLLIALYGATAGKISLLKMEAATNQAVCAIILKEKQYLNYLKFALSDLYHYLINLSTGSARDNLSQDLVKDLIFVLPNDNITKQFNEIINPSIDKIVSNIKENQKLTKLREWLLPMLMNGQVKVGD